MTEQELDEEFDRMWTKTLDELSFSEMEVKDIYISVSHQLRLNVKDKGSHACKLLNKIKLQDCGMEPFTIGFYRITIIGWFSSHPEAVQQFADSIISICKQCIAGKMQSKNNYHDTYIQEILNLIDERLNNQQDVKTDIRFEVSLKQHICGFAAREFQKMHQDFIEVNDPYRCLNQNKEKFRTDFKDLFHERDQCQKKAEEFTKGCLRPAVEDFVNRSLGPDVIGEMLTDQKFSTRMFFQASVLLDLFSKDAFENYLSYICSYEEYVKKWILDQMVEHFSNSSAMSEFEDRHLLSSIKSINEAVSKAKIRKGDNLKSFVQNVCQELGDKLVISQDALGAFMILNNADEEQFALWLTECVKDMAQFLGEEFKKTDILTKLKRLNVNPQNELFAKMIGCGKQCPFCAAPCEAGERVHSQHFASLHRPQALGRFRWDKTEKLVTDVCSSSVISDTRFRNSATKNEWHPYKRYAEIYPDWRIAPDVSLQASDYWKYVMAKFNEQFAVEFNAKPADIPETWKMITREQAEASIKVSFNIK